MHYRILTLKSMPTSIVKNQTGLLHWFTTNIESRILVLQCFDAFYNASSAATRGEKCQSRKQVIFEGKNRAYSRKHHLDSSRRHLDRFGVAASWIDLLHHHRRHPVRPPKLQDGQARVPSLRCDGRIAGDALSSIDDIRVAQATKYKYDKRNQQPILYGCSKRFEGIDKKT